MRKGNIAQQQQPEKQKQQQMPVNPCPGIHDKIDQEIVFYYTVCTVHLFSANIWKLATRFLKNRQTGPLTRQTTLSYICIQKPPVCSQRCNILRNNRLSGQYKINRMMAVPIKKHSFSGE
jgi:hypothetical protein